MFWQGADVKIADRKYSYFSKRLYNSKFFTLDSYYDIQRVFHESKIYLKNSRLIDICWFLNYQRFSII
jgi:hypothetical protein